MSVGLQGFESLPPRLVLVFDPSAGHPWIRSLSKVLERRLASISHTYRWHLHISTCASCLPTRRLSAFALYLDPSWTRAPVIILHLCLAIWASILPSGPAFSHLHEVSMPVSSPPSPVVFYPSRSCAAPTCAVLIHHGSTIVTLPSTG